MARAVAACRSRNIILKDHPYLIHVNSSSLFSLVFPLPLLLLLLLLLLFFFFFFFFLLLLLFDLYSWVQQTYLGVILAQSLLCFVIVGNIVSVMTWLWFFDQERERWRSFIDARVAAKASSGIGRGD
ncbi:hypothetical protein LI328DRAFT_75001 [Trichoderma asperelloides]|nr:hypothetical protein LI328DRAFT_75001 [Trichoderma asperelloides]